MQNFYHPEPELLAETESMRLGRLEERTKSCVRRIDRLERIADEMHTQNERTARLIAQTENLMEKLEKHEKKLDALEQIPVKRYAAIIGAVITALASAIVGGAVTMFF